MQEKLVPLFLVVLDILSAVISGLLAVSIYYDFEMTSPYFALMIYQIPIFIVILVVMMKILSLYHRVWRYAGLKELIALTFGSFASIGIWYGYARIMHLDMPRSIYIIMFLLLTTSMGVVRLSSRFRHMVWNKTHHVGLDPARDWHKILIVGAGDAGAMIAREIEQFHIDNRKVVGFIDDNPSKNKCVLYGIKILGNRDEIQRVVDEKDVDEIIIAIPSADAKERREIVQICQKTKVKTKILPGLFELINGDVSLKDLRDIDIEDLLGREPVKLDDTAINAHTEGKICLITGAGGSIGSEICRQLIKTKPKKLLLLGKGENSIYLIHQELKRKYPEVNLRPIIADVKDRARIRTILEKYKPDVVFHAAAHKHVPLMEYQPIEAVKNNVYGTKVLTEEVDRIGCESFVMISTDKAVNPTSVMGCTKRVAEMLVQSMNARSKTRFVVVRFGNVLGSRGSVVPLFKKQVAQGGPLTVTHKDMKRYFMTIPEASRLVLQAGAMAEGGEVFVLDMGEPVYISDLAKSIITLSGLEPGVDIEIKYTGLRPGEKLFEELLSAEDGTEETKHKKIFTARIKETTKEQMDAYVELLLSDDSDDMVVKHLQEVVPTYTPNRLV